MRPHVWVKNMYSPYVSSAESSKRHKNMNIERVEHTENIDKYVIEYAEYRHVFGSIFHIPKNRRKNMIFDTQGSASKFIVENACMPLALDELNFVAFARPHILAV